MLRPSRLLAVTRSEMRTHMSGRPALRMIGVTAALLLPASTVPTPRLRQDTPPALIAMPGTNPETFVGPPPPHKVKVRGAIPRSLEDRIEHGDSSSIVLRGENPVVVTTPEVPMELRAAMETLDGDTLVEVRDYNVPPRLPGRSLLIAILAISVLTGPLAEALPGERARRTLEVLLTAGITRGELIGGKWLAWTASASTTAFLAAAIACWRGVQAPGWWILGLPLFIGSTVAFGLWLVRLVDDVVGGSAAPMRVLPVAAGGMTVIAKIVAAYFPNAAAAVPLGGPLLVASDMIPTGASVLWATAGSAVFITAVLARTGRDLDSMDTTSSPTRWGAVGLAGVGTLLFWLTVGGPGVWNGGAGGMASDLVTPLPHSMLVGGIALLACAVVAIAREAQNQTAAPVRATPLARAVLVTLAVAAALATSGALPNLEADRLRPTIELMFQRLREGGVPLVVTKGPYEALCAIVSILGQTVLFRFLVARRTGWIVASVLWAVAVGPWTPWSALAASFALGALADAHGWRAAFAAQALWSLAASSGFGIANEAGAVAFQIIAALIAVGSTTLLRAAPMRHQL